MTRKKQLVSEARKYLVTTVAQAREITNGWLSEIDLKKAAKLGLPEVDDRYHVWRVPLCDQQNAKIGEVVIDAYTTEILYHKTTKPEILEARLLQRGNEIVRRCSPGAADEEALHRAVLVVAPLKWAITGLNVRSKSRCES